MSHTNWLRNQVERLETEIRADSIFDTETPPTREELHELREKVVVHTYLRQQLLRRETVRSSDTTDRSTARPAGRATEPARELFDTQEFLLVRK
jgi:hypothetical protein